MHAQDRRSAKFRAAFRSTLELFQSEMHLRSRRPHQTGLLETTHARNHLSCRPDRGDLGHPFVLRPALSAAMADTFDRPAPLSTVPYVQWGPVFAGAVSAAALATVLHAFAGAIGLAVSSTAPT